MPPDADQLGDLLDQHAAALELYASQWTADPEDCVQDAFIELAGQAGTPVNVVAWLYRVVRNRALNASRSARRRADHERLAALIVGAPKPLDPAVHEETEFIIHALGQLTTDDRELIVLRIWSELNWQQIADLTETSTSTAQRRYVATLEKLKQLWEPTCPKNLNFRQN